MKPKRSATAEVLAITAVMAIALPTLARAQAAPQWSPVAGYTVNLGLAGPGTGPVQAVWYTAAGNRLLAQTQSGRVFETTDFQHWQLNSSDAVPAAPAKPAAVQNPEAGVQINTSGTRRYSVTRDNVYGADDAGPNRIWVNLTGFNGVSIIGGGFSTLAVSPSNPLISRPPINLGSGDPSMAAFPGRASIRICRTWMPAVLSGKERWFWPIPSWRR